MLDATQRQQLVERLKSRVKKASSNVSTKVEAEKGDYRISISENGISQYYKNNQINSIKVAELDDGDLQLINSDPQFAAQEMLNEFMSSFDPNDLKTAQTKEAAHSTQSEKTHDMITQKQLDEQKPTLHPRKDDFYTNITQKQLPEHGQRPGTYEVTTEAQFRDERETFYGVPRISGDWRQEDRNVITEGQFNEGTAEYTEIGTSDRGEMGSEYDGGLDKQWHQTGEKQLMELLRHHKWEEPLTVTEGKDQLGKQEGELSRLTAEVADKIIKEAFDALGKTVLSVGATPDDVAGILHRLVSHPSKYPALANTLMLYAKTDTSAINRKVAKARNFGKTANTGHDYSEFLAADVLLRQLAKIAYRPNLVVDVLRGIAEEKDLPKLISEASDRVLAQSEPDKTEDNISIVRQVLAGEHQKPIVMGDNSDGRYAFAGAITEINADPKDQKQFKSAAIEYARKQILVATNNSNIDLQAQVVDVDADRGVFEVQFVDTKHNSQLLEARATRRRKFVKHSNEENIKEAQVGGGGGMPPSGGPEMANPAPPPAGGDMGIAPPGEALSQEPAPEPSPSARSGEPMPPGSICPSCGSQDSNLDNGEFRCNNCGASGDFHISIVMKEWPETLSESEKTEDAGFGIDEDAGIGSEEIGMSSGGEGSGTTLPNVPIGASIRLTGRVLEKLAAQNIELGTICPNCGKNNTELIRKAGHGHNGTCWDCLQEYNFQVKINPKDRKARAEYKWIPVNNQDCNGCNHLKEAFIQSINNYGMKWSDFQQLRAVDQADLIVKMAKGGWLDLQSALNKPLPLKKIAASQRWKDYQKFDKFPKASCIERIARKFGENATSLSGPCLGKNLADCVCSQLESLGIYTDGLAAKVAARQVNPDPRINNPMEECIAMFVRDFNYKVADACTACDGLRAVYATAEELLLESIAQAPPMKPMGRPKPMMTPGATPAAPEPMSATPSMPGDSAGMAVKPKGMGMPAPMDMPGDMKAKPMGDPMDEPVNDLEPDMNPDSDEMSDLGGDSIEIEMSGDLDDNLIDGDPLGDLGDLDTGGDAVGLIVNKLQELIDILQGGSIGEDMLDIAPEMGDTEDMDESQDDILDVGDVIDETEGDSEMDTEPDSDITDDSGDDSGFGESESDSEDVEIPGIADEGNFESDSDPDDMVKQSDPKSAKPMNSNTKPMRSNTEHAEASTDTFSAQTKEASKLDDMLYHMKHGTIRKQSDAFSSVFQGIMRQITAADDVKKMTRSENNEGSKVKPTPAQDADDIGKYKDGEKIGHEESFSKGVAQKPDVPRGKALIGDEGSDLTVSETDDLPSVPHGSKLMQGEEHYKPEKGNVVDGNQGGGKTTSATNKKPTKTAAAKCMCGNADCKCNCNSTACKKPCCASKKDKDMTNKTAQTWTVPVGHKYHHILIKKAHSGEDTIQLTDGNTYQMTIDQNKSVILIPQNFKKESQTISPKRVERLEDDPDLNPSSGPGAGKTHGDEKHSLGVDEKKPSEGMAEPSVPEAPNGGRLAREHTVEKATDGPEIPAGGGMNSEYDQNEKNEPEKLDQMLGKQNDIAAMASVSRDDAMKIAGKMLKANMITADELPNKVAELQRATPDLLNDIQKLLDNNAKGMRRQASKDAVETGFITRFARSDSKNETNDLQASIQSLFKLDKRNKDYENYTNQRGDAKLWR